MLLGGVASTMFRNIAGATGFKFAFRAAIILYIAIFGLMFTMGMVQSTVYEFAVRMIKIIIIQTLVSTNVWNFFSGYVVTFFNAGTDELINIITASIYGGGGMGGVWGGNGDPSTSVYPFVPLDNAIAYASSARMAVTILAIFFTGPYGFPIGLMLVISLGSFLKTLMSAMWVYLMSLVIKTLLFGMAPIFIVCLLFSRTKHLFDGRLNQVVNASLQPIFLFTFLIFFVNLIAACILNIIGPGTTPVCWTEFSESSRGTALGQFFWRFTDAAGNPNPAGWNFTTPFPIPPLLVFTLLILTELAGKFNDVVVQIAQDLAGAATDLSRGGERLMSMFTGSGSGGGGGGGASVAPKPVPATIGARGAAGGGVAGAATSGVGGSGGPAAKAAPAPTSRAAETAERIAGMTGRRGGGSDDVA
jgi:hypothetical protein